MPGYTMAPIDSSSSFVCDISFQRKRKEEEGGDNKGRK